jgi:alpha-D-ribose 1-methylphosphonate 5-triphosphate diphosphatase
MDLSIENGRVLTPDNGLQDVTLSIEGGRIAHIGDAPKVARQRVDAKGALVLPGIVDIHGDAFERQLMPRPGVHFPHSIALMETDKQLIANGITTAYHGVTLSWEPGLRSDDACRTFMAALESMKPNFITDTRLHLRFETANLAMVDETITWIEAGRIDALAFNDHLPHIRRYSANPEKMSVYANRSGLSQEDFLALVQQVAAAADTGQSEGIERLAAAARSAATPQLSHDDNSPATRDRFHAVGAHIAEFPMGDETAAAAKAMGAPIVLGAPNVVRGGSHTGLQSAAASAGKGLCDILASDYYYPALLHAPFILARDSVLPIERAWPMVSTTPADALNLTDRGRLAVGQRADIAVVETAGDHPKLRATIAGGTLCTFG